MEYPKVSVVVPVRVGADASVVIDSLRRVDYPQELIEINVIPGDNPSRQRNQGISRSQGKIVFFFDDDSNISPGLFKETVKTYKDYPAVSGVGGPAVLSGETTLEQATIIIMTAFIGVYRIKARYGPVGRIRYTNEDELISCNLSIKREVFEKEAGFNESLYPNEENELIHRLFKKGYKFIYNPACVVTRKTDSTIKRFLRRIFSYGRGRTEQLFISPSKTSILRLVPLLFLLYLFTLFFTRKIYIMLPLYFYLLIVFLFSLYVARFKPKLLVSVLFLYIATHISYAVGECYGIFQNLKHRSNL